MINVRVIAPMGASVRGPATLRLTKEQHAPRAAVLGKLRKDGIYKLDGDVLSFKHGEEFGMKDATGRLNRLLFALPDEEVEMAGTNAAEGVDLSSPDQPSLQIGQGQP